MNTHTLNNCSNTSGSSSNRKTTSSEFIQQIKLLNHLKTSTALIAVTAMTIAASTQTAYAIDVDASLTIDNGGGSAPINTNVTSNATVNGTIATPGIDVSVNGAGSVFVINGGVLNNTTAAINLGVGSGLTGNMGVASGGSTITNNQALNIGQGANATGTLTVSGNGTFTQTSGATTIGLAASSTGTLTVGSTSSAFPAAFTTTGDLTVGNAGMGTLDVTDNGSFTMTGAALFNVGQSNGSNGTVNVNGANAQLITDANISLGVNGTGTINILAGGSVSTDAINVADLSGSNGTLLVDGVGSSLNLSANGGNNDLTIGRAGTGVVTVTNSGSITVTDDIQLGLLASGDGTLNIINGGSVTANGEITIADASNGTLNISDGGTLTSSGTGTSVVGSQSTGQGIVTISGASSAWNLGSGDLNLVGAGSNVAKIILSDGGTLQTTGKLRLNGGSTSNGHAKIIIGGENIAAAAGNLNVGEIEFDLGQVVGQVVFNHTNNNFTFGGDVTSTSAAGARGIIQQASGTTNLTGDLSGYRGTFSVSGGELKFNSNQAIGSGGITVGANAKLSGVGTVELYTFVTNPNPRLNVLSGGTLAPGNSIGTLTVNNGNVDFANGSIYEVEIDDQGNTDLLEITGTGTLTIDSGASVNLLPENGTDDGSTYTIGQTYTIATATGGITGAFGSISDSFAFVDGELSYTANSVILSLVQSANFNSIATTSNQTNVANAAQALGSGNSVFASLATLTTAQAQSALDALTGEIHSSTKGALINDSRYIRDASLSRVDKEAYAGNQAWFDVYGALSALGSNANAADADAKSGGIIAGLETSEGNWLAGLAVQIGASEVSIDGSRSSVAESSDYSIGSYGAFDIENVKLALGGSYTSHSIKTDRNVVFGSFAETISADYDASTTQFFAKLSTEVANAYGTFAPFAQIAHVRHQTDGFTESGGSSALTNAATDTSTTFTTLGVSARHMTVLDNGKTAKFSGTIGWQHSFGDQSANSVVNFAGGQQFNVEGASIAQDALVLKFGSDIQLNDTTDFNFNYSGQIGSDGSHSHSGRAGLSIKF